MTSCLLPAWALKTIEEHKNDDRPTVYTLEQMANAETHDKLWNAAQRQLIREGVIHNYVRIALGEKGSRMVCQCRRGHPKPHRTQQSLCHRWSQSQFLQWYGLQADSTVLGALYDQSLENFATWPVVPHKRNLKQQTTNVALQRIHSAYELFY